MKNSTKYKILSPDGFTIDAERQYKNIREAKKAFDTWKSRYEKQGYYSSSNGIIDLRDLEECCTLVEI